MRLCGPGGRLFRESWYGQRRRQSPNTALDFNGDVEEPGSSEASIGASENEEMSSSHLCRGSGSCTCVRPEETGGRGLGSSVDDNDGS